jgi:hypothetical protein
MDCTLATLIACFSWSGLYVDTGLVAQDVGAFEYTQIQTMLPPPNDLIRVQDSRAARNPYGRLELGYELKVGSVVWSLSVAHLSSLKTDKDRGVNSVSFGMRWHPFTR